MKRLVSAALILLVAHGSAQAQQRPDSPSIVRIKVPADAGAVPLYEEDDLPASAVQESWFLRGGSDGPAAEQRSVRNVTQPTITPILPEPCKGNGAAVIVAPGGAFQVLAIDKEGYDVARQLAARGIAAFVLKYRLNETAASDEDFIAGAAQAAAAAAATAPGQVSAALSEPRATLDALQALRVVRANASHWNIDPARVGIMGFSAGAITAREAVLIGNSDERPNFLGYIYGPMEVVPVPTDAPPMFAAIALDDELFGRGGFGIVESWQKADRPVELHAYERGGHGFGLGRPGTTTTSMMDAFIAWLESRNLAKA